MDNMSKIEINGDRNQVYSNVKNSRINSKGKSINHYSTSRWIGLASLGVAILGLIVACIANWDKIVVFFN